MPRKARLREAGARINRSIEELTVKRNCFPAKSFSSLADRFALSSGETFAVSQLMLLTEQRSDPSLRSVRTSSERSP